MRSPIARLLTRAGHEVERLHRKFHGRPFEIGDVVIYRSAFWKEAQMGELTYRDGDGVWYAHHHGGPFGARVTKIVRVVRYGGAS